MILNSILVGLLKASGQAEALSSWLGGSSLPLRLLTQETAGFIPCRALFELVAEQDPGRLTFILIHQTALISRTRPENKQSVGLWRLISLL